MVVIFCALTGVSHMTTLSYVKPRTRTTPWRCAPVPPRIEGGFVALREGFSPLRNEGGAAKRRGLCVAKFSKSVGEQYIIYTKDVMVKDNITHIPVYMTMFL